MQSQLLVFGNDTDAVVTVRTRSTLMVFGGEPLGERHVFWNFASSRKERIEQAKADWAAGRFALPPKDNQERLPLPGWANCMSAKFGVFPPPIDR